jgi:hypothetical protein
MTAEMLALQAAGLEQTCPACGLRESAGAYCTRCARRTTAADWHKAVRSEAQQAASSATGLRRAETATTKEKTATPVTLGLGL